MAVLPDRHGRVGTHVRGVPSMSKYLTFVDCGPVPSGKTRVWRVQPKSNPDPRFAVGEIRWYPNWRQYTFFPARHAVFSPDCLRDIAAFCDKAMTERAAQR